MNSRIFRKHGKKLTAFILCLCLTWLAVETISVYANNQESVAVGTTLESQLSSFLVEKMDLEHAVEICDVENSGMNEVTLKLDDGSYMLYTFAEDVKYEDESGAVHYKETSIMTQDKTATASEGFDYTNGENDICVDFSQDVNTGVKISDGDNEITLVPIPLDETPIPDGEATEISLGDNSTESVFTYENVFGEGTRVEYSPQLNGIKENIVLDSYTGENTFDFYLDTHGDHAELVEGAKMVAIYSSQTGKPVSALAPLFAYDSSDEAFNTDSVHYTENCTYALSEEEDGRYKLSVIVSEDWLSASTTMYPVTIDPTVEHTGNIVTGMDCALYSGTPDGVFNTATTNSVGRSTGASYKIGRSMFKYALPSAVMHTEVLAAKYFFFEVSKRTSQSYVRAYMINSAANGWNSNTATWNSYSDAYDISTYGRRLIDGSADWYWFGIPDIVQKWVNGTNTNRGVMLVSEDEAVTDGSSWRSFCSFRHGTSANRPYGAIQYQADEEKPVISSVTGNPTAWTNDSVKLVVNATDNAGVKEYSFDNGDSWQTSKTSSSYLVNTSNIKIKARDFAGNVSTTTTVNITKIDKTAPTYTSITKSPSGWTNGNVTLTVNGATDSQSGLHSTAYSFSSSNTSFNWTNSKTSGTYSSNRTVYVSVRDAVDNRSKKSGDSYVPESVEISNIDKAVPVISKIESIIDEDELLSVTVTATDALSGIKDYSFDNGTTWSTDDTYEFEEIPEELVVKVRDKAGNIATRGGVLITEVSLSSEEWSNEDVTIEITADGATSYSFDEGVSWLTANTESFTENGQYTLMAKSASGDTSTKLIEITNIDKEGPVINSTNFTEDKQGNIVLAVDAVDEGIGIKEYSFDGGDSWQEAEIISFASMPATPTVIVRDHLDQETTETYLIDGITISPNNWTSGSVTVTISTTENTEEYSFDGGETWQIGNSKVFDDYAENIEIYCLGFGDEVSSYTLPSIKIDKTVPEINDIVYTTDGNGDTVVTVEASDALSGVKDYCFGSIVDENSWQSSNSKSFETEPEDLIVYVRDNALNISSNIVTMEVTHNPAGWTNQPVTLTVSASSITGNITDYSFDGGETWQIQASKVFSEHQKELLIIARDEDGNVCQKVVDVQYDATLPEIIGIEGSTDEQDQPVVIVNAVDGPSGVKEYSFDGGITWQEENTKAYVSTPAGIDVAVRDYAGNTTSSSLFISSVTQSPNTWTTGDVTVTVTASCATGATITGYSFDGGDTWQSSSSKLFTEPESYVGIAVKDSLENVCTVSLENVYIDREAPTIKLKISKYEEDPPFIIATVTDEQSGVNTIKWAEGEQDEAYFETDGNVLPLNAAYFEGEDDVEYTVFAEDNLGNSAVFMTSEIIDDGEEEEPGIMPLASGTTQVIPNGIYMIKAKHSGKYLEVSNKTIQKDQPVVQWTRHCASSQKWKITSLMGSAYYIIRPIRNTKYALSVSNFNVDIDGPKNDESLSTSEIWTIQKFSDGSYRLMNGTRNDISMDVSGASKKDGTRIILCGNHSGDNQRFYLEPAKSIDNGAYFFKSLKSNHYMNAAKGGTVSRTNVAQYKFTGGTNQRWNVRYLNNGYYAIRPSYASNMGLDVTAGNVDIWEIPTANNSNVPIYAQWSIVKNSDGSVTLYNKNTEGVADVENNSTASGENIINWTYNGGKNQKWIAEKFQKITTVASGKIYSGKIAAGKQYWYIFKPAKTGSYTFTTTGATDTYGELYRGGTFLQKNDDWSGSRNFLIKRNFTAGLTYVLKVRGYSTSTTGSYTLRVYQYQATVNNRYDHGYHVRYGQTEPQARMSINGYMDAVAKRYRELLGLRIIRNEASYYISPIDTCKANNYNNVATCTHYNLLWRYCGHSNSTCNINALCTHFGTAFHTQLPNVISSFTSSVTGSNTITNALWSGHHITSISAEGDLDHNRSHSFGTNIYMISLLMSDRTRDSQGVLMHELNHQYGAPDHYHVSIKNDKNVEIGCTREKNRDGNGLCSDEECNDKYKTTNRPRTCIMNNSRQDIASSTILCSACKKEIEAHLSWPGSNH